MDSVSVRIVACLEQFVCIKRLELKPPKIMFFVSLPFEFLGDLNKTIAETNDQ